jgi:hypothetical protein
VVGVHVSEHEICLRQINIKVAQTFLHGFKTDTSIESGIDNQVPFIGLDDIGIEFFQRTVGKRDDNPV